MGGVVQANLSHSNFNGKFIPLSPVRFDVYDVKQQKNLACRTQYPIILAFALTVHRAQGQTLNYVEIDCYSFFAPGQMGVAVGRATSTAGLRALNFNNVAANKQHLDIVYQFYDKHFNDFLPDLSCCKDTFVHITEPVVSLPSKCTSPSHHPCHLDVIVVDDLPSLESPWDLNEFINENKSATFLSDLSDDFYRSNHLKCHVDFL